MKKFVAIITLCCVLATILSGVIQAAQIEPITPMWDNTSTFTAEIVFDGNSGTVSVFIYGKSGVTNITSDVQLFYKNSSGSWVEIEKDWEFSSNQSWLSISEEFSGVAGREYKIEVDATVTMNGTSEALSKTATATCPQS